MKIETIDSPSLINPTGTRASGELTPVQRAVAKLEALQAAQSAPVPNPTSVSPEEMGALKAPSMPSEEIKTEEESEEVGQSDKIESSSSEEVVEETKASNEPLSSQYAVLARKEKALRLRDQQLKQKEAALKAQEDALKTPSEPKFDSSKYISKEDLMRDPIRLLLESGLTYDQLTEAAMNGPRQEDIALTSELKMLRDEIKALKGEQENTKKSFEEQQITQRKQAERQITNDVKRLVSNDANFETIRETDSVSDVVELITRTFDEDGILLTVEEAAQQVEDYLVEEALKISRINKIQQRLQPKVPNAPTAVAQKTTARPEQSQMKTLTNAVSTARPLSAKERAIAAFEGKLKK